MASFDVSAPLDAVLDDAEGCAALASAAAVAARPEKPGVVYLSRLPPHMRPGKVRRLLEQHGEITKLYLEAEERSSASKRKGRGKQFVEGWVEFAERRIAKRVAASLNTTAIGEGRYAEDLWAIKFLKGFEWRHLTEKRAYDARVREAKLRLEFSAAAKSNAEFSALVDRRDGLSAVRKRRKARAEKDA